MGVIVVSCGMGTDSIAMLIAAHLRGIRPDAIVWANTGSEHPRTYAYVPVLRRWLASVGFPELNVVQWIRKEGEHAGRFIPLHEACELNSDLPSAAYGYAGCSSKYKRAPIDAFVAGLPEVRDAIAKGEPVERWLGFSADEGYRIRRMPKLGALEDVEPEDDGALFPRAVTGRKRSKRPPRANPYLWRAPLAEWGISRDDARDIIRAAGLPLPGKSACWLCPNSHPAEVKLLKEQHPALYDRAVQIEGDAELRTIAGLGRTWKWADIDRQTTMFDVRLADEVEDMPCGCASRRAPRRAPRPTRARPYAPRAARLDPFRGVLGVLDASTVATLAGVSVSTVRKMAARQAGSPSRALRT